MMVNPICLISSSEDHIVDYKIAMTISELLPNSSAAIIFKEPHMLSKGESRTVLDKLYFDLLVLGKIDSKDVNYPVIMENTVSDKFNQYLAEAHSPNPTDNKQNNVEGFNTARIFSQIPIQAQTSSEEVLRNDNAPSEIVNEPTTSQTQPALRPNQELSKNDGAQTILRPKMI